MDHLNSITLAELIRQIRSSDGVDSLMQSKSILYIDSRPHAPAKTFLDSDGHLISTFGKKFEKGFVGWQPGDRLRTEFLVTQQKDEIALLVSEAITGDIRHSDNFVLVGLQQEDKEALLQLGVAKLDATVLVLSGGDNQASNMFQYQATIDQLHHVQPSFEGDMSQLKERETVLIEGETVSYLPNLKHPYDGAAIQIKHASGNILTIKLWNGYLSFDGGVLPILNPDYPLPGDRVQVSATYGNPGARYRREEPIVLFAYFCRSTYLLYPSQERTRAYRTQRRVVAEKIASLRQQSTGLALREQVSRLIRSNIFKRSSYPAFGLTEHEIQQVRNALADVEIEPHEAPLDLFDHLYTAESINKAYDVDVYAMSKADFYKLCMDVATGQKSAHQDSHTPWQLMHDFLPPREEQQVLKAGLWHFYPKCVGKRMIFEREDEHGHKYYDPVALSDPQTMTFNDQWLFRCAIGLLARFPFKHIADVYLILVRNMYDQRLFCTDQTSNLDFLESEILQSVKRNIVTAVRWKDGQIVSIEDGTVVQLYLSHLSFFRQLMERLRLEGWTNRGLRDPGEYCEAIVFVLEQIHVYVKQHHAHLN